MTFWLSTWNPDQEGTAIWFRSLSNGPILSLFSINRNRLDIQEAGIQDNLLGFLLCDGLQLQGNTTLEALLLEVYREVCQGILGFPVVVIGQRIGITWSHVADGEDVAYKHSRTGTQTGVEADTRGVCEESYCSDADAGAREQ